MRRFAGSAFTGSQQKRNVALECQKASEVADDLQPNARTTGRTDFEDGFYIETFVNEKGELVFRSCTPGGAVCKYSYDAWHAERYLNHLRAA